MDEVVVRAASLQQPFDPEQVKLTAKMVELLAPLRTRGAGAEDGDDGARFS